jgi:hypothetical protein
MAMRIVVIIATRRIMIILALGTEQAGNELHFA